MREVLLRHIARRELEATCSSGGATSSFGLRLAIEGRVAVKEALGGMKVVLALLLRRRVLSGSSTATVSTSRLRRAAGGRGARAFGGRPRSFGFGCDGVEELSDDDSEEAESKSLAAPTDVVLPVI